MMGIRQRNKGPNSSPKEANQTQSNSFNGGSFRDNQRLNRAKNKRREITWLLPILGCFLVLASTLNLIMRKQTRELDAQPNFRQLTLFEKLFLKEQASKKMVVFPRVYQTVDQPSASSVVNFTAQRTRERPTLLRRPSSKIPTSNEDNNDWGSSSFFDLMLPGNQSTQPPAREDFGHCVPMASWQTASYPTCNNMHDIDLKSNLLSQWQEKIVIITNGTSTTIPQPSPQLNILNKGWFRTTWRWHNHRINVDGATDEDDIVVLKTLRPEREFLSEYYHLHNRDAVAMERLTFSPYVVGVYGYCGQSAVNEFADFPYGGQDMKDLEKLSRRLRGKRDTRAMMLRLVVAAGLSQGLAHVHRAGSEWHVDNPDLALSLRKQKQQPALMVHYDINPRNVALFKGGRPKINDYNIAEFIKYDPKTMQPCGFESRMHAPWWRSPEEAQINNNTERILLNEKVDVYSLGSTLFYLFTSFSPRGRVRAFREEEVRKHVVAGQAPKLLPEFQNATDVVSVAFRHILQKCHAQNPNDRWPSQKIADYFLETLHEHKNALLKDIQQQDAAMGKISNGDSTSSLVADGASQDEEDEDQEEMIESKG